MHEEHFPLLTCHPGNPARYTGPLAKVLGRRMKRNMLNWLVGPLAKITGTDAMELLGMDTCVDNDGLFSAWPTGPMGALPAAKKAIAGVRKAVRDRGKPIMRRGNTLVYTTYQPPVPTKASMKLMGSRLAFEMDGHPQPTVCTLQVTTRCQANCIHCSAERHKRQWEKDLSTQEWKRVIRHAEQLGSVTVIFTGGEPLLRSDIFELIEWVDKDEAVAMIFSNGILLTEENVRKLADAGLWCIHVSIDSPDPKAHDEMRKVPGCFEKAVDGLKRCKDAGILTGISTYATPERLHNGQVVELIEFARDLGVDEVTVFDTVPTGKLLHHDRKYLLTDEDKEQLCRIEDIYNTGHPLPHVITQAHVNGPTGNGCYAGWCQFYMTACGEVTPCDFTPLTFGNVRDEDLEDIWERMIAHEAYCEHKNCCRMQDQSFRERFIDGIPSTGPFPYPAANFQSGDVWQPEEEAEDRVWERTSIGIKG